MKKMGYVDTVGGIHRGNSCFLDLALFFRKWYNGTRMFQGYACAAAQAERFDASLNLSFS
jgi:hypothetical protein